MSDNESGATGTLKEAGDYAQQKAQEAKREGMDAFRYATYKSYQAVAEALSKAL
ncbi:hypothetical protein [Streptomyces cinnamoneus]|uniref:HEPN domain-containing protein n=1 Tax=Streptomyces cinnamoneus TaxID=53446 RepID=A0A918TAU5_STRCJ|nr:hypothetical protein [Streptomyces cinnamoneus]GHC38745.1 hypothetical protein GCM10010507_10440 [Streptomyces cinnamoneus]